MDRMREREKGRNQIVSHGRSGILLNIYEATCIDVDLFKEGIIERKYYKLEKVESDYLNN